MDDLTQVNGAATSVGIIGAWYHALIRRIHRREQSIVIQRWWRIRSHSFQYSISHSKNHTSM
jgi:hypothetical protein